MAHEDEYYWCLTHHSVEPWDGCRSGDRLGPYPSAAQAAQALDRAQARNDAWDADPRFKDDDEDKDPDDKEEGWGPFRHPVR
ncbi:hypothetical protein [Acidipropionibacterium timonense]|uniref:hypothetical protein n=1 Tax=Acidipropionibacterium timonense TaxID=2161818 RepID=UPI0010325BEA|nr:hypothetical protein [Acidipropionibacterium timonense]